MFTNATLFKGTKRGGENHKSQVSNPESALDQMKQLSRARGGALSDFDWRASNAAG